MGWVVAGLWLMCYAAPLCCRHLKHQHGVDTMGMQYKKIHYACVHAECRSAQVSFGTIAGYRQHLEAEHGAAGITGATELTFNSFEGWWLSFLHPSSSPSTH